MNKLFVLLLVLLLTSSVSYAAQFDLDHFNGVKWGISLPQKGFKQSADGYGSTRYYARKSDKSKLEGMTVEELTYTAENGRFVSAHFLFYGNSDYQKVRALCQKTFGNSQSTQAGRELFKITKGTKFVTAMLQYDGNMGMVNFNCDRGRK